jgi:Ca-activated chloride channel homolog
MFSNIEFANPSFLLLLLLLPLLAWWYLKQYRNHYAPIRMSNLTMFKGRSSWRGRMRTLLPILRGLSFIVLVVAFARPQAHLADETLKGEGIDIMLSLDISTSMLAQDFQPNRLEAAKRVAQGFIDKRPHDRVGLIIFSGEAFTQCPLTTDHTNLKSFIENIQNGIIEGGTAIGAGLVAAVNRLYSSTAKSKIVVLMTDGKNEGDTYFSTDDGMALAQKFGVKIYTIGIGTIGEALAPIRIKADGQFIYGLRPVEIDETLLQSISQATGGKYYRATNDAELEQIYAEIDRLEKSKIEVTTVKKRGEAFVPWALAGLVLLVLELLLRYTIFRTIP